MLSPCVYVRLLPLPHCISPVASCPQVPAEGVNVPHIKTGEMMNVDQFTVAQFLVLSMADFAEQIFSWQVNAHLSQEF